MKLCKLYRSSWTSLSGVHSTRYTLVLFGFTIFSWERYRRSKPEDWGVIG